MAYPVFARLLWNSVFIALNSQLRRGRRLALICFTLLLGMSLLAAHGAVSGGHMAAGHGGHAMVATGLEAPDAGADADADSGASLMTMCLAIVQAAALTLGALVLAAALAALLLRLPALPWSSHSTVLLPTAALVRRARPPDLDVLQISRR